MKSKYKRILLKLSGESLLPEGSLYGVCLEAAARIAEEIKPVVEKGVQVGIVIGGGNIFRGAVRSKEGGIDQADADAIGMLATAINGLALCEAFALKGVESRVMSELNMQSVAEAFIRKRAIKHLENNRVLIFVGGTGKPYFSTDTAASLKALEIGAEVIFKGTKVDGVYSADPMKDSSAVRFEKLSYIEVLNRQLKVMDSTAVSMCMDHKLPVVVFNMFESGNFMKAVCGTNIGTVVYG